MRSKVPWAEAAGLKNEARGRILASFFSPAALDFNCTHIFVITQGAYGRSRRAEAQGTGDRIPLCEINDQAFGAASVLGRRTSKDAPFPTSLQTITSPL
jgi:hypothetical protein